MLLAKSSVRQVLQAPETSRRSEAFKSCSVPPSVANAAVNWTGQSCLGRTWRLGMALWPSGSLNEYHILIMTSCQDFPRRVIDLQGFLGFQWPSVVVSFG